MGHRVAAAIIDFIPLGILIWLVDSTFGVTQNLPTLPSIAGIPYTSNTAVALPWLYLVMITYYTVQEALFGATIGKFLVGLKVVRDDGSPVTFVAALIRSCARPIDGASGYMLGWVLALCSSRRRRLGDHLARTLVVREDSVPATPRRSRSWLGTLALLCALFVVFCLGFGYYGRPPLVIQGMANSNDPASMFADRGTITDLSLSQPDRQDNTVTYTMTFHALKNGVMSNCQGRMTLTWFGFTAGWRESSSVTTCKPRV